MKVKDLYQVIKDTIELDAAVLDLDVCSQISYAKYYDSVNPLIADKADPSKTSAIIKRQLTSK